MHAQASKNVDLGSKPIHVLCPAFHRIAHTAPGIRVVFWNSTAIASPSPNPSSQPKLASKPNRMGSTAAMLCHYRVKIALHKAGDIDGCDHILRLGMAIDDRAKYA